MNDAACSQPVDEREAAIRRLLPMVRQLARRVLRVVGSAEIDDLVGDGSIGLIRAVDTFDDARGATLEVYARRLVVGAMLNGLRKVDPVSERVRRTMRIAEAKRLALAQERGTMPSFCELERDDPRLRRARIAAYRQTAISLDAALLTASHALAESGADPGVQVESRARSREIAEAIALLPERQRRIVMSHYSHEMTLLTISARMAVSPQRVSQLHLGALERLRRTVASA